MKILRSYMFVGMFLMGISDLEASEGQRRRSTTQARRANTTRQTATSRSNQKKISQAPHSMSGMSPAEVQNFNKRLDDAHTAWVNYLTTVAPNVLARDYDSSPSNASYASNDKKFKNLIASYKASNKADRTIDKRIKEDSEAIKYTLGVLMGTAEMGLLSQIRTRQVIDALRAKKISIRQYGEILGAKASLATGDIDSGDGCSELKKQLAETEAKLTVRGVSYASDIDKKRINELKRSCK